MSHPIENLAGFRSALQKRIASKFGYAIPDTDALADAILVLDYGVDEAELQALDWLAAHQGQLQLQPPAPAPTPGSS